MWTSAPLRSDCISSSFIWPHFADKVIQSSLSIAEVNALLPPDFVPIHRCYTVNARYVTAIRRYEVTMVTGEKLPVPPGVV